MKDEEYVFRQDVREKSITGRSAHRQRTHCGRGGRVRFPSDNLTKKEREKLNGECKTYRLNSPMKWAEFKAMPDEHKISYIKLLRQKFNVSDRQIGTMLGISQACISKEVRRLGISGAPRPKGTKWDEVGWSVWAYGEAATEQTDPYTNQEEPISAEDFLEAACEMIEEPAEEHKAVPVPEEVTSCEEAVVEKKPLAPASGSMSFDGSFDDVLRTVAMLLGGCKGTICVQWCLEVADAGSNC